MNERNIKQTNLRNIEKGIRITLLSVFLLSSILKSLNIDSFAQETRLYVDAYMEDWLRPLVMTGAITVCSIEMIITLISLNKEYKKIVATGFFLMLSFFVYLTGMNLFFPTVMGSIESCGCFGELIHFTPTTSFIKSVVLWVLSLVLVIASYRNNDPWNITRLLRDKYLHICIAVSMVLPLYSLWFFNELSHAVYICGFVVLCIILTAIVTLAYRHTKTEI